VTSAQGAALHPSPWLTVWRSPRDTIERIVAGNPRRHVLLLAALGGMATVLSGLILAGLSTRLSDQHLAIIIVGGGLVLGVAGL
jgi:hypothetical protein